MDYKGTIREDNFFNILHEDGFAIAGITEDKTVGRVSGISGSVPKREGTGEKCGEAVCERKDKTGEVDVTRQENRKY